jgi:hypothetical protein
MMLERADPLAAMALATMALLLQEGFAGVRTHVLLISLSCVMVRVTI